MPRSLPPGLYEQVLTKGFREQLRRAMDLVVGASQLDADEAHLFLSQHLHGLLRSALQAYPQTDRLEHQLDLSNQILDLLASEFPSDFSADDHVKQQLLESLFPGGNLALQDAGPPRPGVPLSQSELLVNARGEYRVGHELIRCHAGASPLVALLLKNPLAQRLGRTTNLLRSRQDRRPLRRMLVLVFEHHPNGQLADLGRIPLGSAHDSKFSKSEVSGRPGSVHFTQSTSTILSRRRSCKKSERRTSTQPRA